MHLDGDGGLFKRPLIPNVMRTRLSLIKANAAVYQPWFEAWLDPLRKPPDLSQETAERILQIRRDEGG
ncbi:LOW QUALITY PROTEIN: hypothetical protein CH63R_14561 [Colletotrichum higginsianum IMI 349063]|uniref:Uncharacterized protein n=1 Tax=Colletotrichum higginsianum (strain IMI 349063) TaxID=759273 RepID=A0A1B7XQF4_COLHI|nr:LOW QUALITY PROTEIN: hypothetical protein CH63R_14561 [Colletotrichum higginsianum IMI 349063]OBR01989.1 LOW QUALITY PROTEIN: hypothetical protein CH63R_14561 [Colletotrichum higginsianum IMI 349063]GJD05471.1 hypothetical protein ColKHC_14296 [Colletotrichum higginsianum]